MYIINSFVGQLLLSFLFFKVIIVHYHLTPKAKENKIQYKYLTNNKVQQE